MPPPVFLVERNGFAAKVENTTRTPRLIEARNILHHPAATFAEIVFLLVRIHRRRPFHVESQARRIFVEFDPEPFETFKQFDRERADSYFIDIGPECPRRAEIILPALMPYGRESVLHVSVGILTDAETENRILVADVVDTYVDAFSPFGIVSLHMVHRGGQLMAHEFVPFAQHRNSP